MYMVVLGGAEARGGSGGDLEEEWCMADFCRVDRLVFVRKNCVCVSVF